MLSDAKSRPAGRKIIVTANINLEGVMQATGEVKTGTVELNEK